MAWSFVRKFFQLNVTHPVNKFLFPGIPDSFPFYKKVSITKNATLIGYAWDSTLVGIAVISCVFYVLETYFNTSHLAVKVFQFADIIMTSMFTFDLVLGLAGSYSAFRFFVSPWTVIDILSILPFYLELSRTDLNLKVVRLLRLFRLIRVLKVLKLLHWLHGTRKQAAVLGLTTFCMIFIGAGVVQVAQNEIKQILYFQCNFIGPNTNYLPSCLPDVPFTAISDNCDCNDHDCTNYYNRLDLLNQPSGVQCFHMTFFDAFYFMIVTIATLGN